MASHCHRTRLSRAPHATVRGAIEGTACAPSAEIKRMSDGMVIATAEGFVGEDELSTTWYGGEIATRFGKKTLPKRPDYAIRAMAQTRAISRTLAALGLRPCRGDA